MARQESRAYGEFLADLHIGEKLSLDAHFPNNPHVSWELGGYKEENGKQMINRFVMAINAALNLISNGNGKL